MIWKLVKKDIQRRIRQPAGYLILVAMPLVFALLIGSIFGSKGSKDTIIRVDLLVEDHDNSFASQFIMGAFGRGQLKEMFNVTQVDSSAGRPMMNDGKASALLIIPDGFGDSLLHEKPAVLTLVKNPSEAFAPKIAEETFQILAEGGDRLFTLARGPLNIIRKRNDTGTNMTEAEAILMGVQMYRLISKVDNILFPPLITLKTTTTEEEQKSSDTGNLFAYVICSMMLMTLLFSLEVLSRDFFTELEDHTFMRQRLAIGATPFIGAKLLFIFISGIISYVLVWSIAIPLFGISLSFVQIGYLGLFAPVLMAGLTGVIAIIYALARTRQQASSIAPAVIITFCLLGGVMIPVENLPPFIRGLSLISPVYWGAEGLRQIVLARTPLTDISGNMLILGAIALGLLVPALILQQRKFRT